MSLKFRPHSLQHERYWEELLPQLDSSTRDRVERARGLVQSNLRGTEATGDASFKEILAGARFAFELSDGAVIFRLPDWTTPTLPTGYGFKGGIARGQLFSCFDFPAPPARDADLIRKVEISGDRDDALALQFMPRDFGHGSTVEVIRNLNRYFQTRDVTVNEVAIFGQDLIASTTAVLDTIGLVFRPSRYRSGSLHRKPGLRGRILLKMVRLRAEMMALGVPSSVFGVPEQFVVQEVDYALELNRAFERGVSTAELFCEACAEVGLAFELDGEASTLLEAAVKGLAHFAVGSNAVLSNLPVEYRKIAEAALE